MNLWDTSAVVKLYVHEVDSARLTAVATQQVLPAMVSHLVETELWSTLVAKELARSVPRGFAQAALNRYRQTLSEGVFAAVAINARVQEGAEEAVRRCARGRNGFALRAMDALHLGTALVIRCDCVVTTDVRQRQGAALLGLKTLPD